MEGNNKCIGGRRMGSSLRGFACSVILTFFVLSDVASGYLVDSNPYRHVETLDEEGKYILEWMVDWESKRVIFNVTAETNGYVGFGLSRRGKMTGADLIIGGVSPDGKPYFSDRHAIGNQMPELDDHQDWDLHAAIESGPHTFLSFSRPFETCDKEDYPITGDVISLIWSYGENDNTEEYHFHNRGHYDAFLLDPDLVPRVAQPQYRTKNPKELGDLKVWSIHKMEVIPPKETYYTCTFHKAPRFKDKQHIVGFNTAFLTGLESRFIRHFVLYRCHPPVGRDAAAFFERFTRNKGEQCYTHNSPTKGKIPTMNCREPVHTWSMNGKAIFLPDHVGIPMSESANEYYMLQTHYENPILAGGIRLRFTLEVFYTDIVRKHDAGVMLVGHKVPGSPSLLIPPSSLSHFIYGHCGSGCTKEMFPSQGIQVFAASLHTNMAGKGVRLLHVRGDEELPWISYDDNYNYVFQQTRILRKERTVMPGDQLITRCMFDTAGKPFATVGGVTMRNERCLGAIWYYNKIPGYGLCDSEIRSESYLGKLGISNATWSDRHLEMIVNSPAAVDGLGVTEVCSRHVKWTIARRNQLQEDQRFFPQVNDCPKLIPGMESQKTSSLGSGVSATQLYARERGSGGVARKESGDDGDSPVLQRYVPHAGTGRKDVKDLGHLKESEFISVFSKDVVPFQRPPRCVVQEPSPKQLIQGGSLGDYPLIPATFPKGSWWAIESSDERYTAE